MVIIKSKKYLKDYQKIIINKNMKKEMERIANIENIFLSYKNMQELYNSPYKNIYHIEQKKANLKEYFTARINNKLRLMIKPLNEYPYNYIEIIEIEFLYIDDKHYGEG